MTSFLERMLKEKSVRLEATSEPKDPRGDLTINRVNTVMQLWYRFNFKNEYIPVYSNSDVFVTS